VLCLGDSFHDADAEERIARDDRDLLTSLTESLEWTWICGNHDPHPSPAWGGKIMKELTIGPLTFRHQAAPVPARGEISGHYHPKIGITMRGRHVSGRCFLHDGRRLILPAFGTYTGGLDARDRAIAGLFPTGFQADVIGRDRMFRFQLH
jgi:DNA ligase-associated metallophosphoesterase